MRRPRLTVRLLATLVAATALANCKRESTSPAAALIGEPSFLTGAITEAGNSWGYRIKGEPGTNYKTTEAYFSVQSTTTIQHLDGTPATAAELVVGRRMSLWITGPIAESYPPQVTARAIVLE